MRLEFRLLVIDDDPASTDGAVSLLQEYLVARGFSLKLLFAQDLTEKGIRDLARRQGREYDLVIIDYNLGQQNLTGSIAANRVRVQLPYTDIIFYSSNQTANLLAELAAQNVAGVFVAFRTGLGDAMIGVAETIIGKAVDLNHMRGIAMAEVAEMDVMIEGVLHLAFASGKPEAIAQGNKTLKHLLETAQENLGVLEPIVKSSSILEAISDGRLFSSAHKFFALQRVVKCLPKKPEEEMKTLATYIADVLDRRNTLAHALEQEDANGEITLRSAKKGAKEVSIDEDWMNDFRRKLHSHRNALEAVCSALRGHFVGGPL